SGSRNKASLNIDENGIHTLYVSDIFERVWPQTIRSLETIGVTINFAKENDGVISISASEVDEENTDSFFSNLIVWKSDNSDIKFNLVMSVDKEGTLIEVQDNNYLSYTNIASEEIMRALYSDFR
ncbi:MAG: outer membrane protein assembly factor BamC, partial [Pseudomonadota bacterium]|nr:outer membrane protein assembly factor BamC [Pseudomonadota bacterium]